MSLPNPHDAAEELPTPPRDDRTEPLHVDGGDDAASVPIGEVIGRYVVTGELGRGGGGTVVEAFDSVLDRVIALKLVRGGDTDQVLHEARILARLSHANIVTVHDAGSHVGRPYIAMERIRGPSFEAWCAAQRDAGKHRSIIAALVDISKGLAAAHAAGVVHGDIKPSNVLVDADGRVYVSDFGVARVVPVSEMQGGDAQPFGTPAYMAPEQHAGGLATAASDQYSFCLMAWALLTGRLPYDAPTTQGGTAPTANDSTPADHDDWARAKRGLESRATIPGHRRLTLVLRRGLRCPADERWPGMDAMTRRLGALAGGSASRPWIMLAGAATMLAAGASLTGETEARCTAAVEALGTAWDDERRAAVEQAFGEVDGSDVATTRAAVLASVDSYAERWIKTHTEVCEATAVHGTQSTDALDLKMACLERSRLQLDATARVLADADRAAVSRAHDIVARLPSLTRCDDLEHLRAEQPMPPDDERPAVAKLDKALAEISAQTDAGRSKGHVERLDQLADEAAPLAYETIKLRIDAARASMIGLSRDPSRAYDLGVSTLERALQTGHLHVAGQMASELAFITGVHLSKPDEAQAYAATARGLLRAQRDERELTRLLTTLARVATAAGDYTAAEHLYREVLAAAGPEGLDDGRLQIRARTDIASTYLYREDFAQARQELRSALVLQKGLLGPAHPDLSRTYDALSTADRLASDFDSSLAHSKEAVRIGSASVGPRHPDVGIAHFNLGQALDMLGRHDEGLRELRTAAEIQEESQGANSPSRALTLVAIANLLRHAERDTEAVAAAREALDIQLQILGPDHPQTSQTRSFLGSALLAAGDLDAAALELERARASLAAKHGDSAPPVARVQFKQAEIMEQRGMTDQAASLYRTVLAALLPSLGEDHPHVAVVRAKIEALTPAAER